MSGPQATFYGRLKIFFRKYRLFFSGVVLAIGAFLSLTSFAAYTPLLNAPPFSSYVPTLLGPDCTTFPPCPSSVPSGAVDWVLLFVILGGILDLIGLYLVAAYLVARQRFEHLMKTKSKAEFLRNQVEVEDLLWDLTPEDEMRLLKKKQELRIRE